MSEIPYYFETPIPSFFRKDGWFKTDNTLKFVTWSFSKCSIREKEVCHDGKRIILKPFQFIFGRLTCSLETNMSEDEVRTQVTSMEKAGFLKKCPNKTPKRFTIFEWVWKLFPGSHPPSKPPTDPQVTPNKAPQTRPIESRTEISKGNEDEQVLPLSKNEEKKAKSSTKFPLKKEQKTIFNELKQLNINTDDDTFCFWIRSYPEKIKVAISYYKSEISKNISIDNPGGFIQNILKGKIIPETDEMKLNSKFALDFAKEKKWSDFKITKKFIRDNVTGSDLPLFMPFKAFEEALLSMYNKSITYKGF